MYIHMSICMYVHICMYIHIYIYIYIYTLSCDGQLERNRTPKLVATYCNSMQLTATQHSSWLATVQQAVR